jgi:hypothetical protein
MLPPRLEPDWSVDMEAASSSVKSAPAFFQRQLRGREGASTRRGRASEPQVKGRTRALPRDTQLRARVRAAATDERQRPQPRAAVQP